MRRFVVGRRARGVLESFGAALEEILDDCVHRGPGDAARDHFLFREAQAAMADGSVVELADDVVDGEVG